VVGSPQFIRYHLFFLFFSVLEIDLAFVYIGILMSLGSSICLRIPSGSSCMNTRVHPKRQALLGVMHAALETPELHTGNLVPFVIDHNDVYESDDLQPHELVLRVLRRGGGTCFAVERSKEMMDKIRRINQIKEQDKIAVR
jgi:hypothetical protein